jgi:hypothetical protein
MSDEPRNDQTKIDRPSAPGETPPPAGPASATDTDQREAQVKAVKPTLGSGVPLAASGPMAPPLPPAAPPPPPPPAPGEAPAEDADADADELDDDDADDDEPALTIGQRLRRLSPALIILSVGSILSLIFLAIALTSHTTPVPVILSSAVTTGLIFAVDAAVATYMTYHAGLDGRTGKALLLAVVGGTAAVISAGAFGGTAILLFLLNG